MTRIGKDNSNLDTRKSNHNHSDIAKEITQFLNQSDLLSMELKLEFSKFISSNIDEISKPYVIARKFPVPDHLKKWWPIVASIIEQYTKDNI